jgi:hypothetical protein
MHTRERGKAMGAHGCRNDACPYGVRTKLTYDPNPIIIASRKLTLRVISGHRFIVGVSPNNSTLFFSSKVKPSKI